eukprot:CAMPEP_0170539682 /NCGR_PEP_ID=MMETSP0209-20121228/104109_1 /TAXON_ID=665100 ORGANISM="Litonotus pictus, Strain P1" /NCGR_SAMPLE_ID=MMETSP0209 /ASSEMBLY_ACC=CAM_ASM_000301 /LENGTH=487 /DNA_ID=CAMNT_0010841727 /DNA_START=263 /DNA_END=1727 /DNA_ORIENTATION=-
MIYAVFNEDRSISLRFYNEFRECDPDSFTTHKEWVKQMRDQSKKVNATPFCFNYEEDFAIQNPYGSYNSSTILMILSVCNEDYRNIHEYENGNEHSLACDPQAQEKIQLTSVSVSYMNSFLNPKNYSDPVVYYEDTQSIVLDGSFGKDYRLELISNTMFSDNGWVLESIKETEVFSLDSTRDTVETSLGSKLSLILSAPYKKKRTTRSYLKAQELFAKIGGLFNAVNIICQILLYDYIRFKYRIHYSRFALGKVDEESSKENLSSKEIKQVFQLKSNNKTGFSLGIKEKSEMKDNKETIKKKSDNFNGNNNATNKQGFTEDRLISDNIAEDLNNIDIKEKENNMKKDSMINHPKENNYVEVNQSNSNNSNTVKNNPFKSIMPNPIDYLIKSNDPSHIKREADHSKNLNPELNNQEVRNLEEESEMRIESKEKNLDNNRGINLKKNQEAEQVSRDNTGKKSKNNDLLRVASIVKIHDSLIKVAQGMLK